MSNNFFQFKQFTIWQDKCAMKVTSLACIQGAWLPDISPKSVLDIGAGTGILTLMAAQQFSASIDSVEIDDEAFVQLAENVRASKWSESVNCHHKSIQDFANENSRKYDLIITNPPFFQNQLRSPEQRVNVARHENALTIDELINIATKLINNEGVISILLPMEESKKMVDIARSHLLYPTDQLIIADNPYKNPKAAVTLLSRRPETHKKEHLLIKDGHGMLSSEYKTLLSAYYLNL